MGDLLRLPSSDSRENVRKQWPAMHPPDKHLLAGTGARGPGF